MKFFFFWQSVEARPVRVFGVNAGFQDYLDFVVDEDLREGAMSERNQGLLAEQFSID